MTISPEQQELIEKRNEKLETAQETLLSIRHNDAEERKKLLRRQKEREQVAEKIKSDLAEVHKEYFELMRLRKQDQEENYNRYQNAF